MTTPNKDEINSILEKILFPDNLSILERSSEPVIHENNVAFTLDISGYEKNTGEKLQQIITNQVKNLHPDINVSIVLTSTKSSNQLDSDKKSSAKIHIENVANVIVITSGKGGVGKSTMTSLLAHKLKNDGKTVGILDADIYGPSIPRIFNTNSKPELEDKRMIPLESFGIKLNSIGFITAAGASISWRGPMVSKALYQLVSLTKWGDLDYLLIDMPPGTGDIHMSLLENYAVDGVIFVTTPQIISEIDVSRSISLYKKYDVKMLGIIENMNYIIDPDNGKKIQLFPGQSGSNISKMHSIPMMHSIAMVPELAADIDNGKDLSKHTHLISKLNF